VRRIVATGGGTRDQAWIQALADCTALPVDVAAVPEGAALGAVFLGRMAAGMESSIADAARWARISHRVEPDPRWVGASGERYEIFRQQSGGPPDEAEGDRA
jgi:xylulokinase